MQNGSISIGKELQRHGQFSHGSPDKVRSESGSAPSNAQDQINFRVYPSDNTQVYDLAAIGLRKDATLGEDNYDIPKFYSEDNSAFQLFTLSTSGTKLSGNGVPLNTDTVQLNFKAPTRGGSFIIEASNISTLSSEGAWLLDKFNDTMVDLKVQPQYAFTSAAGDQQNRFRVYFQKPQSVTTDTDGHPRTDGLFSDNTLILRNLNELDVNSLVRIYDVEGKILSVSTINAYPEFHLRTNLPQGVYVVQVKGQRNIAVKVVKNK